MYFYDLQNNVSPITIRPTMQTFSVNLTFALPQCILTIDIMNKTKNFLSLH
jgi:hypothetical protein